MAQFTFGKTFADSFERAQQIKDARQRFEKSLALQRQQYLENVRQFNEQLQQQKIAAERLYNLNKRKYEDSLIDHDNNPDTPSIPVEMAKYLENKKNSILGENEANYYNTLFKTNTFKPGMSSVSASRMLTALGAKNQMDVQQIASSINKLKASLMGKQLDNITKKNEIQESIPSIVGTVVELPQEAKDSSPSLFGLLGKGILAALSGGPTGILSLGREMGITSGIPSQLSPVNSAKLKRLENILKKDPTQIQNPLVFHEVNKLPVGYSSYIDNLRNALMEIKPQNQAPQQ